ncbi:MAG TPA: peptide chain release factor N(5)-glutamine methyltransferase [Patescibacteria group bacterium]|nr:peptide chain release factor N(5)-glutamine methyltransferase [Patescibacteria group bacterium]
MSIISVDKALKYGTNELRMSSIPSARLDAEILISFLLGCNLEKLISNTQYPMTNAQFNKYKKLISKRKKNYPIAYIVGKKEFYGIDFYVNEDVLVPRPETELIVENVINYCRGRKFSAPTRILEIGTGSGCIALTLAKYLPKTKITAVDISEKALKVARYNLRNTQYPISNIRFKKSDLLQNIKSKPDIIVANLPYLTHDELQEPSITKEPRLALYGGKEGLEIYEKLFSQIKERKWDSLSLFLEINPSQKNKIIKIAKKFFPNAVVDIKKDLAKKDRVVIVEI